MAKKIPVSFKENDAEMELYMFINNKFSPSTYLKELAYEDMKKVKKREREENK